MHFDIQYLRLMLVTQRQSSSFDDYIKFILNCIQAGVTSVQLREKHLDDDQLYLFACKLKQILDDFSVPLIINDRLEVAVASHASGVHLGQQDQNSELARSRLGPDKIIGLTVNSIDELIHANSLSCDYIGVGAIFPTKSKPDVTHIWGIDELKQAVTLSQHPIVAIGGINEHNIAAVLATGVNGVATISLLHDAKYPELTIKHCLSHF